ncbi:MAG TPA: pilus assembly protein PilM [Alcanivoracaceae bacterium]|nr:pilus assembly protein PilM [Alcanivoracaceae bacterium]
MLPLLGKKTKSVLGIDISSTAVKLLELTESAGRLKLRNYGVQQLEQGAVVDGAIVDVESVGDALALLVARTKPKTKWGAIAVSGGEVITKTIPMEAVLTEAEIEDQVTFEAGRHIPYPIDEVSMDFCVLGPVENNPSHVQVLLVASRTENVQQRIDVLEIAGLKPAFVDVEAYAVERAFYRLIEKNLPNHAKEKPVALFDVGGMLSTLHVLHDGRVVYSRDQGFGGRQLTEEIERRYGMSFEEAELAKKYENNLPDDYAEEVLKPFKEALAKQLNRSLQYYYSSMQGADIAHIVLAGGAVGNLDLQAVVEEATGISCSVANPVADMTLSERVNMVDATNDAPALLVACGLALRSFDR